MSAEVGAPRRVDVRTTHARVVRSVADRLARARVASPDADARWIVEHVLRVAGDPTTSGAPLLASLVARRAAREPLQLVVGSTAFRTVELSCRPGVFIPRPETEVVAGVAIDRARLAGPRPVVVEPCTGTGAIAAALAVEVAASRLIATEVDPAAVLLASDNLAALEVSQRTTVLTGDLLDPLDPALRGHLDVLVANPPYLPAADRATFDPEVGVHDPDRALIAGPDGHEVVDRLLALAADWLAPGGSVVLEIDARRGADAASVARSLGLVDVEVRPDLTGADRVLAARRDEARHRPGAARRTLP